MKHVQIDKVSIGDVTFIIASAVANALERGASTGLVLEALALVNQSVIDSDDETAGEQTERLPSDAD